MILFPLAFKTSSLQYFESLAMPRYQPTKHGRPIQAKLEVLDGEWGEGNKVIYGPGYSVRLKIGGKEVKIDRPQKASGLLRFTTFGDDNSALLRYSQYNEHLDRDWIYQNGSFEAFDVPGYDSVFIESYDNSKNFRGTVIEKLGGKGAALSPSFTFEVTNGKYQIVAPGKFCCKVGPKSWITYSDVDLLGQPCAPEYVEKRDLFLTTNGKSVRLGEGEFAASSSNGIFAFTTRRSGDSCLGIVRRGSMKSAYITPGYTVIGVSPHGAALLARDNQIPLGWDFKLVRNGVEHALKIEEAFLEKDPRLVTGSVEWINDHQFTVLAGLNTGNKKVRFRLH